jgi:hypothetical protein
MQVSRMRHLPLSMPRTRFELVTQGPLRVAKTPAKYKRWSPLVKCLAFTIYAL